MSIKIWTVICDVCNREFDALKEPFWDLESGCVCQNCFTEQ